MRTVERLGRALLRLLAGVRRGTRRVPVHVVPGPPPHWVERVRQGAPGLLEPPPREPVGARVEAVPQLRRPLRRLQWSLPRPATLRAAEPTSQPPPPAAVDAPVASPIVRRDPPPGHEPPPPAAATEQSGPTERPPAPPIPARPRLHAARQHPAPLAQVMSPPAASWGQAPGRTAVEADISGDSPLRSPLGDSPRKVPPSARPVAPPVRGPGSRLAQPRPGAEVALAARDPVEAFAPPVFVQSELATVHTLVTPIERAPARDPWPTLPPTVAHHDADPETAIRAWERTQRVDREQVGL